MERRQFLRLLAFIPVLGPISRLAGKERIEVAGAAVEDGFFGGVQYHADRALALWFEFVEEVGPVPLLDETREVYLLERALRPPGGSA